MTWLERVVCNGGGCTSDDRERGSDTVGQMRCVNDGSSRRAVLRAAFNTCQC